MVFSSALCFTNPETITSTIKDFDKVSGNQTDYTIPNAYQFVIVNNTICLAGTKDVSINKVRSYSALLYFTDLNGNLLKKVILSENGKAVGIATDGTFLYICGEKEATSYIWKTDLLGNILNEKQLVGGLASSILVTSNSVYVVDQSYLRKYKASDLSDVANIEITNLAADLSPSLNSDGSSIYLIGSTESSDFATVWKCDSNLTNATPYTIGIKKTYPQYSVFLNGLLYICGYLNSDDLDLKPIIWNFNPATNTATSYLYDLNQAYGRYIATDGVYLYLFAQGEETSPSFILKINPTDLSIILKQGSVDRNYVSFFMNYYNGQLYTCGTLFGGYSLTSAILKFCPIQPQKGSWAPGDSEGTAGGI